MHGAINFSSTSIIGIITGVYNIGAANIMRMSNTHRWCGNGRHLLSGILAGKPPDRNRAKMSAELLATYAGLGTQDGQQYYRGEECLGEK